MKAQATRRLPCAPAGNQQRLESCLAGFASGIAFSGAGLRIFSGSDPDALLACVLREIDETILPRRIRIETRSGLVAHLQVSARRLVHLDIDGEPGAAGIAAATADETARWFIVRLLAFLSGTDELALRTSRMAWDRNPAEPGCLARHMARVASVDLDRGMGDRGMGDRAMRDRAMRDRAASGFFEAIARLSVAWLNVDPNGRVIDCDGPGDQTAWLVEFSRENLAQLEYHLTQTSGAPGTPGCLMLDNHAADGVWLVCSQAGDARFLALVPQQGVARIQPLWQRFFGTSGR